MRIPAPKRNRRPLNVTNQSRPALAVFGFDSMAVGDQTLILVQQNIFPEVPVIPVFGPLEDVEWSLVADIGGAIKIPDSASISSTGDTLELVFTGVIVGDYRLVIPAWSEAFRGQFGAWIAPTIVPVQCTV